MVFLNMTSSTIKNTINYKFIFSCLVYFVFLSVNSQNLKKVAPTKNFYLKGHSVLIGNQILGGEKVHRLQINDHVDMEYIDIDGDDVTFSSSSAALKINARPNDVVYAALYWVALYPSENSVLRQVGNKMVHKLKGERDSHFNRIKLKVPEQEYIDIVGQVLFDGKENPNYAHNKPYVCVSDITDLLKNSKTLNGNYTVANMKATTGKISGGSAAGWMLYIIIESEEESAKYISVYDGFVKVDKETLSIDFKGFNTKEADNLKSHISMGIIDGDAKIKTDKCSVFSKKENRFMQLYDDEREANNFFNSSITVPENEMPSRNPNHSNTLGFDLIKMGLPPNSLSQSSEDFKVQFYTKADALYLFFTAFETEITNTNLNQNTLKKADSVQIVKHKVTLDTTNKDASNDDNDSLMFPENVTKSIRKLKIKGMKPGYYLITNVFSDQNNLSRWLTFIESSGFSANYYINPKNNWHYVYVVYSEKFNSSMISELIDLRKKDEFKEAWIAQVE